MEQKVTRPSLSSMLQSMGLLILRVGTASLLIRGHGWEKVANFTEMWNMFQDPLGLGSGLSLLLVTFAEVVCAVLIALGLFTRLATIPIIIDMLVVLLFVHIHNSFAQQELGLLYLVPAITLLLTGPGWYSLDHLRRRKRRAKKHASTPATSELSPVDHMPKMDLLPGAELGVPDASKAPS